MAMYLSKIYRFEAAHQLPDWPDVHGHSYEVEIFLKATDKGQDYVLPLSDFDAAVEPILKEIDHKMLNALIDVPTMENIARWFARKLTALAPVRIIVRRPSLGVQCIHEPD
jgi:6-pyruvoyltetrahydropterin/6-carboxytetrahydropterin synthase